MHTVFVSSLASVQAWVNAHPLLTGEYGPITKGAQFRRMRSPFRHCYVLLSLIGGSVELFPEKPDHRARIAGQVFGVTLEQAERGAVAYANALHNVQGAPVTMGEAVCDFVTNINGPLDATIGDEPRFTVDADFYLHL